MSASKSVMSTEEWNEKGNEEFKNMKIRAKVSEMLDLAFNVNASEKEREIAMNNLFLLACDEAGANEIFKKEGVSKIAQLVKVKTNEEIICSAIRIVSELCKNNISRTESVIKCVGLPWCLEIMNSTSLERVNASQCCLQNILNTYIIVMNNKPDSNSNKDLYQAQEKVDTIMLCLLHSITSTALTGPARDAVIKLITHNIRCVPTLDYWAKRFVELHGVQKLMQVASEMEEYNGESLLDITSSTRTITSVCLAKIYENLYCEDKKTFINAIDEFIANKLDSCLEPPVVIESKVRVVAAITTLLLGPSDVGNAIVAKEGFLEMILVMAGTNNVFRQKVALECIVAAVTKKDKVDTIINQGINILKKLCQSKYNSVRVRALVAFCKMANSGDSDVTIRPFADGTAKKLVKACSRLLTNEGLLSKKGRNMKELAVKGLSYLTFNAKVKEELIEDLEPIFYMVGLAYDTGDQSILFDTVTTLVNLCNAYDEQEPEMIKLRKFVKYHFPEESELDDDNFEERLEELVNARVITDLFDPITKTDNQNCKELLARVFNACSEQTLKELVADEDGMETLLSLALDGTVKGKKQASLALVRLALTKRPEVIFPAQLITEVVQPIVNLLNLECSVHENCQILTALCNLAKVNDSMREHIFKEGVFQKIEAFVHEGDYFLRKASVNLMNIYFDIY